MRLVSTKESVARGEVSILAIVETLLAIALVFYLSAHFNTLRWLAVAICVSPLLLLRTENSVQTGLRWLASFERWRPHWRTIELICIVLTMLLLVLFSSVYTLEAWGSGMRWWPLVVGLTSGVIVGVILATPFSCIRIGATLLSAVRYPLQGLAAIPQNWKRTALATDSATPVELVPGSPVGPKDVHMELGRTTWFVVVGLYPAAIAYRWSLKATSIIYAPLVFVAHSTFSEGADLRTRLELIKRGDLSRIRVWYGVIVIAAFLVKLVLMMKLPGFADWWNRHLVSQFLALYVAPAEIPKWQLAELANSVLAIGSMLFARHALLRYELRHPWPEVPVKPLLGFVSGLRWVLALYAILCTGYITMRAAQHWHWPALGEKWLPW